MLGKIILLCIIILGFLGSAIFFLFSFNQEDVEEEEGYITTTTGEKIEIKKQEESVRYNVLFDAVWNPDNHTNIPTGAHFSPFVAWNHKEGVDVFKSGEKASEGMRLMAETGGTEILKKELSDLQSQGLIGDYSIGQLIYSPSQANQEIEIEQDFRYVSFVSMLAPSPDWFAAVRDVDLFKDREWQEIEDIPLVVYDAGTDSGDNFHAVDQATEPQGVIHSLLEDGVNVEEGGGTIAYVSFMIV